MIQPLIGKCNFKIGDNVMVSDLPIYKGKIVDVTIRSRHKVRYVMYKVEFGTVTIPKVYPYKEDVGFWLEEERLELFTPLNKIQRFTIKFLSFFNI